MSQRGPRGFLDGKTLGLIVLFTANHEQMAAFNVTALQDFGYGNVTGGLEDPMDPRFTAKIYSSTDLSKIRGETLPYYAGLNAYPDPKLLEEKIDQYWSTYRSVPKSTVSSTSITNSSSSLAVTKTTTSSPVATQKTTLTKTSKSSKVSSTSNRPTTRPTPPPTLDGTCGKDNDGRTCKGWTTGECCSKWGWCGIDVTYCGEGCQSGPCWVVKSGFM